MDWSQVSSPWCSWSSAWLLGSCRCRWQQTCCCQGYQIVVAICCGRSPISCIMACLPSPRYWILEMRGKKLYFSIQMCNCIWFKWLNGPWMTGLPFAWSHLIGNIGSAKRPTRGLVLEWHLPKQLPKITTRPEWQSILLLNLPSSLNPKHGFNDSMFPSWLHKAIW
jgi:hypothetical protein